MRKLLVFFFFLLSFASYQISGQTWSSLKRFTWNSGDSWSPVIATDSGLGVHVVWYDSTPGNSDIFYKNRK